MTKNAYAQSGVDVEAGYEVVARIKKHVARTERLGVLGALGGFGGMFDLCQLDVKEPVLISGTDGVSSLEDFFLKKSNRPIKFSLANAPTHDLPTLIEIVYEQVFTFTIKSSLTTFLSSLDP